MRRGSRGRLRFAADDRLVALVRRGDAAAFEALYDRHAGELLSFCRSMLASRADAEDAIQSTFASAHRALLADDRRIDVRPWLFTIARNACLSILRAHRRGGHVAGVSPVAEEEDPVARAERRDEVRQLLATLGELPERQRVALVLAELHGFSHGEIGAVLGVHAAQVKAYVYQARSNLISERDARAADCRAIRHELANAHGPALLASRLRRHLRSCEDCRAYASELSRQRRQLGILLPVTPSLALKRRALEAGLGRSPHAGTHCGGLVAGGAATSGVAGGGAATGASVAATGAELVGGGAKALIAKLLVGVGCLGAGSGAATLAADVPAAPVRHPAAISTPRLVTRPSRPAPVSSTQPAAPRSARVAGAAVTAAPTAVRDVESRPSATPAVQSPRASPADVAASPAASSARATIVPATVSDETHGRSEEAHGKAEEARGGSEVALGKAEEPHGRSEEAHGEAEEAHGRSEEAHGEAEEAHGKAEEPHGKAEEPHGESEEAHGKGEDPQGGSGGAAEGSPGESEEAHANRGK